MDTIRKGLRKYNPRVLSLLVLYENIKTVIYKVLGSAIWCIMDKYICLYYPCLKQAQPYLKSKSFENTTFNDISEIGIPSL